MIPSPEKASNMPTKISLFIAAAALALGCANMDNDKSDAGTACTPGAYSCSAQTLLKCITDGSGEVFEADCAAAGKVCVASLGCATCDPDSFTCKGLSVVQCDSTGTAYKATPTRTCDGNNGEICFNNACVNACSLAKKNRSYVGCEYWAVDLDNAVVTSGSAASQQFAVAVSNPSVLTAKVTVSINSAAYGSTAKVSDVVTRTVKPGSLEVINLAAREVDGSPPGKYNTGGGTAVTPNAYRIVSTAPIIAYQFNPLSNVGVFSNDASLLVPTSALTSSATGETGAAYRVMSWPQTIAKTNDTKTNFGEHLRTFLTVVGTRDQTKLKVKLSTDTIADTDGKVAANKKGDTVLFTLNAYDVLNLETGDFGADFTGSRVDADKPVVVFAGSEASDVPNVVDLSVRRCCADHLEHQLFPITTLGKTFIALKTPSRTKALYVAGATITPNDKETEYFRILTAGEAINVTTNLPSPKDKLQVPDPKDLTRPFIQIETDRDFTIQATGPVVVGQFVAGQQQAGIPSTLPGGDPSFILLPSVEQFRKEYLFLTPDKYAFDFILVAAPQGAVITLDGRTLKAGCDSSTSKKLCCTVAEVGKVRLAKEQTDTLFQAYKCQLSFPKVKPGLTPPNNLEAGDQNDGVHLLKSTKAAGLVVYGFDAYVSYGYTGGTDLTLININ